MRRMLLVLALLLALPFIAQAQDEAPKVEIFGGYSYLRGDDGISTDQDLHGWNASFTTNINKWFGIAGDFSGHYGDFNVVGVNADFSQHFFLVGPRVALRKYDRFTPFGHVLLGVSRINFSNYSNTGTTIVNSSFSDSAFAMAVGGGVDVKVTDNLAFRLFQTDYVLTRFNSDNQNSFRASTGLVLRLGSQ